MSGPGRGHVLVQLDGGLEEVNALAKPRLAPLIQIETALEIGVVCVQALGGAGRRAVHHSAQRRYDRSGNFFLNSEQIAHFGTISTQTYVNSTHLIDEQCSNSDSYVTF